MAPLRHGTRSTPCCAGLLASPHLLTQLPRCTLCHVCMSLRVQAARWQAVHQGVGPLGILTNQRHLKQAGNKQASQHISSQDCPAVLCTPKKSAFLNPRLGIDRSRCRLQRWASCGTIRSLQTCRVHAAAAAAGAAVVTRCTSPPLRPSLYGWNGNVTEKQKLARGWPTTSNSREWLCKQAKWGRRSGGTQT